MNCFVHAYIYLLKNFWGISNWLFSSLHIERIVSQTCDHKIIHDYIPTDLINYTAWRNFTRIWLISKLIYFICNPAEVQNCFFLLLVFLSLFYLNVVPYFLLRSFFPSPSWSFSLTLQQQNRQCRIMSASMKSYPEN